MKKRVIVVICLLISSSLISCGQKSNLETVGTDKTQVDQVITGSQTKEETDSAFFEVDISHNDVNKECCNILKQDDGFFAFEKEGGVPQIYDGAKYFGIFCSDMIQSKQEFQGAIIKLDTKEIGSKDSLLIEARGSTDGSNWGEWYQADENKTNAEFNFTAQYIQFRITIAIYTKDSKPIFKISSLKLKK